MRRSRREAWPMALAALACLLAVAAAAEPSALSDASLSAEEANFVAPELRSDSATNADLAPKRWMPAAVSNHMLPSNTELLEVSHFPWWNQVRSVSGPDGSRRRMMPYGGMDMTLNPYRYPNDLRSGPIFFTPKISNGMSMGPDPGLALANIINSQHALFQAQFTQGVSRMGNGYEGSPLGRGFGTGGPGAGVMNRAQRPYGVDPYSPPFAYSTPPPLPSTTSVPDISTSGPGGGSSSE